MNVEETLALFAGGETAWNRRIQELLDERKVLETAGKWGSRFTFEGYLQDLGSLESADWIERATIRFPYGHKFTTDVDFRGAIFPSKAIFEGVSFLGTVKFGSAKFLGQVSFEGAHFAKDGNLPEELGKEVLFGGTEFMGYANFSNVKFSRTVLFGRAQFHRNASFAGTEFLHTAKFGKVGFSDVQFNKAKFRGDALFGTAVFGGFTEFDGVEFFSEVSFLATSVRGSFSLSGVTFHRVPEFIDTDFRQPPHLKNLRILNQVSFANWAKIAANPKEPTALNSGNEAGRGDDGTDKLRPNIGGSLSHFMAVAANSEAASRFRALKRWAAADLDHHNETGFFAQEMRCRRFWEDRPFGRGADRFWLGLLYEKFSDFGRSLVRPFLWWLLIALAIWPPIYLSLGGRVWETNGISNACRSGNSSGAFEAASQLALNSATLRFDWLQTDPGKIALGCLYGVAGRENLAQMPLSATFASVLQSAVSGILIFLFVLGLRNLLRLR